MGYVGKLTAGLALFAAAVTAFDYAIYHLIQTGTCASGGPYLSARPCPKGTGTWIATIPLALIVGLLGLAVYGARGAPPDRSEGTGPGGAVLRGLGAGVLGWSVLFISTGAAALWAVVGPHDSIGPGSKTAGIVLGAVFIPMGAVPLVGALLAWAGRKRLARLAPDLGSMSFPAGGATYTAPASPLQAQLPRPAVPTPVATAPPPPSAPAPPAPPASKPAEETPIDRLNQLARLRDAGVLSPEEFEQAKARVLSDMTRGK